MATYCITAVNRKNEGNDCISECRVFTKDLRNNTWSSPRRMSIYDVAKLIGDGNTVLSAKEKESKGELTGVVEATGAAIEIELRIDDNGVKYKLTDMPEF